MSLQHGEHEGELTEYTWMTRREATFNVTLWSCCGEEEHVLRCPKRDPQVYHPGEILQGNRITKTQAVKGSAPIATWSCCGKVAIAPDSAPHNYRVLRDGGCEDSFLEAVRTSGRSPPSSPPLPACNVARSRTNVSGEAKAASSPCGTYGGSNASLLRGHSERVVDGGNDLPRSLSPSSPEAAAGESQAAIIDRDKYFDLLRRRIELLAAEIETVLPGDTKAARAKALLQPVLMHLMH